MIFAKFKVESNDEKFCLGSRELNYALSFFESQHANIFPEDPSELRHFSRPRNWDGLLGINHHLLVFERMFHEFWFRGTFFKVNRFLGLPLFLYFYRRHRIKLLNWLILVHLGWNSRQKVSLTVEVYRFIHFLSRSSSKLESFWTIHRAKFRLLTYCAP